MTFFIEQLLAHGKGYRRPDDIFFVEGNRRCMAVNRLGIYDVDDEDLCHEILTTFPCHITGCSAKFDTLLDFETHYNGRHRFPCSMCRKQLPSAHLLDLHISETHDSFFLAQAERTPMYQCYVEECKERFQNAEDRRSHCISQHQFPHDFRYDHVPHKQKKTNKRDSSLDMEVDNAAAGPRVPVRQPGFKQRGGRMWHSRRTPGQTASVDVDSVMKDLHSSLPQ